MTLIELFHETRDRYYYTHGFPPVRMRANRGMKEALWRELEESGMMTVRDDSPYRGFSFCFQFEGVHIDCDLPTNKPTFLAD